MRSHTSGKIIPLNEKGCRDVKEGKQEDRSIPISFSDIVVHARH